MNSRMLLIAVVCGVLFASPLMSVTFAYSPASVVSHNCSVTIVAENMYNTAIQTALNEAATGVFGASPKVCVGPGSFPEQLNITASTASGISLYGLGTHTNPTVIMPGSVVVNSYDPDSGNSPVAAIIAVGNSSSSSLTGIIIHNIVVDGSAAVSSFSGCATDYRGIYYLDASGAVSNDTITNTYLPSGLQGCQDGQGVYVTTVSSQASTVSINHNQVINYDKNGITCNDAGTKCTVSKNTVYPYSAVVPYIAPNGIQIGFGAVGKVTSNSVSGNICGVVNICGSNPATQTQSCGILTYESAAGTFVTGNTANGNQVGVCGVLDSAPQNSNTINGSTAYAVLQYDGTYSAKSNTLSSNPAGFVIISDGLGPNDTSTISSSNHFTGNAILLEILTTSPGTATVHYSGHTYSISGDANVTIT